MCSGMSDWGGGVSEEGESPLHIRVGKSLEMEAEGWRLGILAGMGMGISEATGTDIGNNGGSLGSLGYAEPRLGRLGMLGKDLAISQNPRGGNGTRERMTKRKRGSCHFPLQSLPVPWDWGMQRPD